MHLKYALSLYSIMFVTGNEFSVLKLFSRLIMDHPLPQANLLLALDRFGRCYYLGISDQGRVFRRRGKPI